MGKEKILGEPPKGLYLKFQTSSFKTEVVRDGTKMTNFGPFFVVFRPKRALKIQNLKKMRDPFLATQELRNCGCYASEIQRTYTVHTYRQKGETGETRGEPKNVTELRTGQYAVQICEIVQFSDYYWFVKGTYRLVEK